MTSSSTTPSFESLSYNESYFIRVKDFYGNPWGYYRWIFYKAFPDGDWKRHSGTDLDYTVNSNNSTTALCLLHG